MSRKYDGQRMFSLLLPEELYDRVAAEAERDDRSMAYITRLALEAYFERSGRHNTAKSSTTASGLSEIPEREAA